MQLIDSTNLHMHITRSCKAPIHLWRSPTHQYCLALRGSSPVQAVPQCSSDTPDPCERSAGGKCTKLHRCGKVVVPRGDNNRDHLTHNRSRIWLTRLVPLSQPARPPPIEPLSGADPYLMHSFRLGFRCMFDTPYIEQGENGKVKSS